MPPTPPKSRRHGSSRPWCCWWCCWPSPSSWHGDLSGPSPTVLKRFQQEELPEQGLSSGISEVDELAEFLNARARNQRLEQGELPPNIAELFDQFVERKDLLTEAERNILRYYIDGHEIADIPDLAFISMSTVRKHNRSIYEKLGVASRDELMLYIDLLRRCGRLTGAFLILGQQYSKAHKTKPMVLCAFSIIQWIPFVKMREKVSAGPYTHAPCSCYNRSRKERRRAI